MKEICIGKTVIRKKCNDEFFGMKKLYWKNCNDNFWQ
jgi:hypothetical protein